MPLFLHLQQQYKKPLSEIITIELWFLVDPEKVEETIKFKIVGTGHPIEEKPENLIYLGSTIIHAGQLVFHIFIVTN